MKPTYRSSPIIFPPIFAVLCIVLLLGFGITRAVNNYYFNKDIEGHLKRAADSNTIELAKSELGFALKNIEARGLTNGNTGIITSAPGNDVGFWYQNLKAAKDSLDKEPVTATEMEKTNMLMKLRETILDHTDKGDSVTTPDGISIYPNNLLYALWGWISLLGTIISFFCWYIRSEM